MLQHTKSISLGRASSSAPEFSSPAELLESLVHFLRQQYRVILSTSVLTIALGVIYLLTTPASFTAVGTMLIDTRKAQSFQQQPAYSDSQIDSAFVESQVRVLKSDNVALSVIKNLRLNEDSEFVGSGSRGEASSEYDLMRRALGVFAARLNVKRDGLSYVIEISFRSYDPDKAARIANAVVDSYIVDQLDVKYQSTLRASSWLQERIRELRAQASAGEQAVVDFKKEHNIIDAAGKSTIGQRVGELNSQLIIVRAQTAEARARLDRIQTVLSADSSSPVNATVTDTLKSEVVTKLRSQYLELANREADWSERYGHEHLATVNLRNQMREIRSAIVDELRRLAETYKSDFEIATQRGDNIQKEYDNAVTQAEKTNQAQVVLKDLESRSQTFRALYENFLQRYVESVQQQSFPITEAHLISPAARPLGKSHPKTFLTLALAACAGIMIGFGIGVFRDLWDRVFRTSEQVETILQTTCIALVPLLKSETTSTSPLAPLQTEEEVSSRTMERDDGALCTLDDSSTSRSAGPVKSVKLKKGAVQAPPLDMTKTEETTEARILTRDNNVLWTVVDSPFSRFAESIRSIKVAIDLSEIVKSNKIIGFTSSLPMEGKSTMTAALALLIAQAGGRVILLDCDLRNPTLTRTFSPSAKTGFIEVISEKAALDDVVWTDPKTKLAFLPAVMKSRVAHTNEILASTATKNLFEELRRRYEYIIVDLSPLAPVVDVRTTTHLVNSYVYVVEWGVTKIDVVKRALADAPGIRENLLGAVLNKADVSQLNRYAAHRGAYYDNKDYARYGYTD